MIKWFIAVFECAVDHEVSTQVSRARAWLDCIAPWIPCIFTSISPWTSPNITSMSTRDNSVMWWPWLMLSYYNRIIRTNRYPFWSGIFNMCCMQHSNSKSPSDLNLPRWVHPDLVESRLPRDTSTTELPRMWWINHACILSLCCITFVVAQHALCNVSCLPLRFKMFVLCNATCYCPASTVEYLCTCCSLDNSTVVLKVQLFTCKLHVRDVFGYLREPYARMLACISLCSVSTAHMGVLADLIRGWKPLMRPAS